MNKNAPAITLVQYAGMSSRATLSPPCGKVHMALGFKGLDYEVLNVTSPGQARKYNPRGRVPVLMLDGESFVDSTDILTELDRRFPDPPLEPPQAGARAAVKILEDWADEVLYFYGVWMRWVQQDNFARLKSERLSRLPIPLRWVIPTIAVRTVRRRLDGQGTGLKDETVLRREIAECYTAIENMLEAGPFLVGASLTRADLAVAAMLDQQRVESLTPDFARQIAELPRTMAWLDRVHESAADATTLPARAPIPVS